MACSIAPRLSTKRAAFLAAITFALGLAACTPAEDARAREQARETAEKAKRDAEKAGREIKNEAEKASQSLDKGLHDARTKIREKIDKADGKK